MDSWLQACNVGVYGVGETPENVHVYAVKYRLFKSSLEHVQLSLLEFPRFADWHRRHDPFERLVPIAQHPDQLKTFQTWVDLVTSASHSAASSKYGENVCQLVCPQNICSLLHKGCWHCLCHLCRM